MSKFFLVILVVLSTACKDSSKVKKEMKSQIKAEEPNELIVKINFKTNKEDDFKLMLNNIIIDEFQKKNVHIIETVVPSNGTESLLAKFGTENISNDFRISFGNKEIKKVEILSMELSYGEEVLRIKPETVSSYFSLNKYVTQDTVTNIFQTHKINGKHIPVIILKRRTLNSFIKK